MTIFNKYYMIDIEQGGEWLWQKVLNTHNSLKRMQFNIEKIILVTIQAPLFENEIWAS